MVEKSKSRSVRMDAKTSDENNENQDKLRTSIESNVFTQQVIKENSVLHLNVCIATLIYSLFPLPPYLFCSYSLVTALRPSSLPLSL